MAGRCAAPPVIVTIAREIGVFVVASTTRPRINPVGVLAEDACSAGRGGVGVSCPSRASPPGAIARPHASTATNRDNAACDIGPPLRPRRRRAEQTRVRWRFYDERAGWMVWIAL